MLSRIFEEVEAVQDGKDAQRDQATWLAGCLLACSRAAQVAPEAGPEQAECVSSSWTADWSELCRQRLEARSE